MDPSDGGVHIHFWLIRSGLVQRLPSGAEPQAESVRIGP